MTVAYDILGLRVPGLHPPDFDAAAVMFAACAPASAGVSWLPMMTVQPEWICPPGAVQPVCGPACQRLPGPAEAPDGQGAGQGAGGASRV